MDIKTKLSDYKTGEIEVSIDGKSGVIVVHSLSSKQWADAVSVYQSVKEFADKNKIEMETIEIIGLGVFHDEVEATKEEKVKTKFGQDAWINLIASLVKDWPFELSLNEALHESPELLQSIDVKASALQAEYLAQKKA